MRDHDHQLIRCFASVFPTLSDNEIRTCDVVSLLDLDSLAAVTLLSLIDEEFGMNVEVSQLVELRSFDAISQFLRGHDHSSTYGGPGAGE